MNQSNTISHIITALLKRYYKKIEPDWHSPLYPLYYKIWLFTKHIKKSSKSFTDSIRNYNIRELSTLNTDTMTPQTPAVAGHVQVVSQTTQSKDKPSELMQTIKKERIKLRKRLKKGIYKGAKIRYPSLALGIFVSILVFSLIYIFSPDIAARRNNDYVTNNIQSLTSPAPTKPVPTPTQPTSVPTVVDYHDSTPPVITSVDGPADGTRLTTDNFCYYLAAFDNTSGINEISLQWRLDNNPWSSWSSNLFICFSEITNGSHTITFQIKDKDGINSPVIIRNIFVSLPQNITITLTGILYIDENCNGLKEPTEKPVSENMSIDLLQIPELSVLYTAISDNNGTYNYSFTLKDNESLTLKLSPVSTENYISNSLYEPRPVTFNAGRKSYTQDLALVPVLKATQCNL